MRVRLGWKKENDRETWKGRVKGKRVNACIHLDMLTIREGDKPLFAAFAENATLKKLAAKKLKEMGVKTYDEIRTSLPRRKPSA